MSFLSIPLHTNAKTRLSNNSRRVLWLVASWLGLILISWFLANLWFGRDSLSAFAPKETVSVIHLTPSTNQWQRLIEDFGTLSLVFGRPITLKEIMSYKPNELAIFILSDNQMAVAIKTSEKNLPKETLASYNVNIQKLTKNRWLLSAAPLLFSSKKQTDFHLSSVWPNNLGVFSIQETKGTIFTKKSGYSFKLSSGSGDFHLPNLPTETLAATVVRGGLDFNLLSFFNNLSANLDPLNIISGQEIWQELKSADSIFLLSKSQENSEKIDFLIKTSINAEKVARILQAASVLQNPITKPMEMPDGSLAREILASSPETPNKTIIINGQEIQKINTQIGIILALNSENNTIITSNQTLLENFLVISQEKTTPICDSKQNLIFINPSEAANFLEDQKNISNSPINQVFSKFNALILNNHEFSVCY